MPQLLSKNRLSNNVGGVKHFLSELRRALEQERHFARVEDVPYQPRLARNHCSGQELRSDPCISSITYRDHDYYFELLFVKRSGMPNQLLGVRRHTIAISGLSRVRTELFHLLVIPTLTPHPVEVLCLFSPALPPSLWRRAAGLR